jgi:hypothetical protein
LPQGDQDVEDGVVVSRRYGKVEEEKDSSRSIAVDGYLLDILGIAFRQDDFSRMSAFGSRVCPLAR